MKEILDSLILPALKKTVAMPSGQKKQFLKVVDFRGKEYQCHILKIRFEIYGVT